MSVLFIVILITCAALVAVPAMRYGHEMMSDKDIEEATREFEKLFVA